MKKGKTLLDDEDEDEDHEKEDESLEEVQL